MYYAIIDYVKKLILLKVITMGLYCHPLFVLNYRFKSQNSDCNDNHYLKIVSLNIRDIGIISAKGVDYGCIIHVLANMKQFNA